MVNRNRGSTSQAKQLLKATKNLEEKKEKVDKKLERAEKNVGKRKVILKKPTNYAKTIEKAKNKVNQKTRHFITALETDLTLQGLYNNLQKALKKDNQTEANKIQSKINRLTSSKKNIRRDVRKKIDRNIPEIQPFKKGGYMDGNKFVSRQYGGKIGK